MFENLYYHMMKPCVSYAKMRVFSGPNFPENKIFDCPYTGKMRVRENPFLGIFDAVEPLSIICRSSHQDMLLEKGVLKICRKFKGEHPCRSAIAIKLHGCSPLNLWHIFRTPFTKNTSGWLLLYLSNRDIIC